MVVLLLLNIFICETSAVVINIWTTLKLSINSFCLVSSNSLNTSSKIRIGYSPTSFFISSISDNFRDIEAAAAKGDQKAIDALNAYHTRVKKYIGSYAAAMNGVDAIAFTAGLGENDDITRKAICEYLGYLGTELDEVKNDVHGETAIISTDDSKVTLLCVPTNEELLIARRTKELCK